MSAPGEIVKRLFGSIVIKPKGRIKRVSSFKLKSGSITPPISCDINGDGHEELLVCTQSGELMVFDDNGRIIWKFAVQENISEQEKLFLDAETGFGITNTPLITETNKSGKKEIIFGTELGKIYSVSTNGTLLWTFNTDNSIRGGISLIDVDGDGVKELVFGGTNKHLYILEKNGVPKKAFKIQSGIESTPNLVNGLLVFGTNDGNIIALNDKLKQVWSYQTKSKITSMPVALGEQIIVTSTDNSVYCIDKSGNLLWQFNTQGSIYSTPVIEDIDDDGYPEVVFGSCDNQVYVLSDRGLKKWSYETDFWVVGTPLILDIDKDNQKEVIIGSYDTNMYILSGTGTYNLNYVPGISGIITQEGSYSDIPIEEPGQMQGSKIWSLGVKGIIIGWCKLQEKIATITKDGNLHLFIHETTK